MSATALNQSHEDAIEGLVRAHLTRLNQSNLEKNLAELLDLNGGFVGRFHFFMPYIPQELQNSILISGCSAGSELIVARNSGFRDVVGTEIHQELVDICKLRTSTDSNYRVDLYDGGNLPYPNNSFDVIYSGHIIEHTLDPYEYFREHFRVLRPGGFFFLEFPNRYHRTELHTGLPSFEWLPTPLRNLVLRLLSSRISPYGQNKRFYFDIVRRTLSPISVWQIKSFLRSAGTRSSKVIALQIPAPGFVRILLKK